MFTQRALGLSVAVVTSLLPGFVTANNPQDVGGLPLKENQQIIQQQGKTVTQKAQTLDETSQQVQDLQTKKEELARQLEENKKAVEELHQKIAAKQSAQVVAPVQAAVVVAVPTSGGAMSGCGDNQYAAYIYGMESGGQVTGHCNPSAVNGGGCRGIGQACPGSKLVAACPNLDYACQNAYFTNYAISRYGSWAGAYNAWRAQGWW